MRKLTIVIVIVVLLLSALAGPVLAALGVLICNHCRDPFRFPRVGLSEATMVDNNIYLLWARNWFVAVSLKLLLWIKRANTIVCRECGLEIQLESIMFFLETGCLQCGCTKLKAVRQ